MLLPPHTDSDLFLVICELIDKLSGSLGGYYDGVDRAIGDRLNEVIVGDSKGSKATSKKLPPRLSTEYASPTLMPPHANFQLGPKVGMQMKLNCINILIDTTYSWYIQHNEKNMHERKLLME